MHNTNINAHAHAATITKIARALLEIRIFFITYLPIFYHYFVVTNAVPTAI